MKCNQSIQHIIFETSEKGFNQHLNDCKSCSTIQNNVDSIMDLLDRPVEIPTDLNQKIRITKKDIITGKKRAWDFVGALQFTTVIIAGVLLGVVLGKNANIKMLITKNEKKTESLIEYKEKHHLNTEHITLF